MTCDPAGARRVEATWRALAQVQEVIRFADLKAGAVLAGSAALGGITATAAKGVRGPTGWLLAAGAGLLLAAALLALRTLAPRVAPRACSTRVYQVGRLPQRFVHDRSAFVDAWLALGGDDAALAAELAHQLWIAQLIATRKFTGIGWAIRALATAAPLLGAVLLLS
ncbi:hypothetical protein GCM10010124_21920 [Pilimelia terevasa]|uniref:Pycsar effector protein domain-containing protein n=1 Tax=Pilimelia terevasa TaxID=53372 RepID=A0A8J3BR08_9ACTN|nr:Pycsar system effector family protein [Pilimelia terevasa]GGK28814.1 hypothetical protein GCM10010124_21920 [Pilimelia terevasa]